VRERAAVASDQAYLGAMTPFKRAMD